MDVNEKLSLQVKLKPNERLSCASCALFFEDVLSAAEHIISCKGMPLNSRKRKNNQWTDYAKRRAENKAGIAPKRACHASALISSHWNKRTEASLLKAMSKWVRFLGDVQHDQSKIWTDISTELINEFPWALQSVCQIKWRRLCEDANSYDTDAMNHTFEKPQFYFVVREFQRRIKNNQERSRKARLFTTIPSLGLNSVKLEGEDDSPNEEDLADPDAVEEDPFSGVLDSQGNTIMREILLEIVQSLESFDYSVRQMAAKHCVEEAIIEWVKNNQDAVTKGSLRCCTCDRRILKRKDYLEHVLDCAQTTKVCPPEQPPILNSTKKEAGSDEWPSMLIAKMIRIFAKTCHAYISPQGILRAGVWLEVYKGLRREIDGLTPKICSLKWRQLVFQAKEYTLNKEDCENKGIACSLEEPPFHKAISVIVDLTRANPQSDDFATPSSHFLDTKGALNDEILELPPEESPIIATGLEDNERATLPLRNLNFKRNNFSVDIRVEEPSDEGISDSGEEIDFEDHIDSEIGPLIEFDSSEESEPHKKNFSLPDTIEPTIHLLSTSKDASSHYDEERLKSEPLLKGVERKTNIILSRLSHLEEETQQMKYFFDPKDAPMGGAIEEKLSELQGNLAKRHSETNNLLENMTKLFERHHKETLDALNKLTNAILDSRKS